MNMSQNNFIYLLVALLGIGTAQAAPTNNDVKQSIYKEECASCHMAYPAWLLPGRSWQKIMMNLDNHFGDNASLDQATLKTLTDYLQNNSAENSHVRRAYKIRRSISRDTTPIRISELPYIRRKHDEIPNRYIKANPKVNSLANCAACHQGAEQGSFDDDNVRIPGYGRWDD
ncbi:MAG: diheme cytochrome c [Gammaproteobacteria bacterium]